MIKLNIIHISRYLVDNAIKGMSPAHTENILHFIKLFKSESLEKIPPSLFILINSISKFLIGIAKKDPNKVRSFLNYWVEKIELEVLDQSEYDHSKYLMRLTLAKILGELQMFPECLKICNSNIKEISAEAKLMGVKGVNTPLQGISPEGMNLRQSAKGSILGSKNFKEKIRVLIECILLKVDCISNLRADNENAPFEMIQKCESLIKRYDLSDDTKIVELIKSKRMTLETIREDGKEQSEKIYEDTSNVENKNATERSQKSNRSFKVKNSALNSSGRNIQNQGMIKLFPALSATSTTKKSPDIYESRISKQKEWAQSITTERQTSSPKNVKFFTSKMQKDKDSETDPDSPFHSIKGIPDASKGSERRIKPILRNANVDSQGFHKSNTQQWREPQSKSPPPEFSNRGSNPSKIPPMAHPIRRFQSVTNKEELHLIEDIPDKPSPSGFGADIETGSNLVHNQQIQDKEDADEDHIDESDDNLDEEIKVKVDAILKNQSEWEKQRILLSEKLQKWEKNIEKQTADESQSTNLAPPAESETSPQKSTGSGNRGPIVVKKTPLVGMPKKPPIMKSGPVAFNKIDKPQPPPKTVDSVFEISPTNTKPTHSTDLDLAFQSKETLGESSRSIKLSETSKSASTNAGISPSYVKSLKQYFNTIHTMPEYSKLRLKLAKNGVIYDVEYTIDQPKDRTSAVVTLKLFEPEDLKKAELPIAIETLNFEQLKYIMQSVHALEVAPSHIPWSGFSHLGHFLALILHKFVQVMHLANLRRSTLLRIEERTSRSIMCRQVFLMKRS